MIDISNKCIYRLPNQQICNCEGNHSVLVSLYHPKTERKSKQKWILCDTHLDEFLITEGKDWVRWKKEGNDIRYSFVQEYKILKEP